MHTSYYLRHLGRKQTVTPHPPHLKNITTLPYKIIKMHNFFIWLKVCCIPPIVGGSDKSRLCVGIGGSEKNRLWCVANGMSDKQRCSKCSKWHLLHGYTLPVIFATDQLHRPPRCAEIQSMSQQDASSVSRIGTRCLWKKWKRWKMCAFNKVVRWHFSGVVGKGVTVCVLLR